MTQIHVNGRSYELVTLDELTLDEAITVYEYAKVTLDQIPDLEGFHPGVTAALIHVSVARGEPGETQKTIRRTVGAIPVVDLQKVFVDLSADDDEEVAQLPPPHAPGAPTSSGGSSNGSGAASSPPGAPPPASTEASGTGSPGSDIGATSDPVTSAA